MKRIKASIAAAVVLGSSSLAWADDAVVNDMLAEAVAIAPYCKKVNPEKSAEFDEVLARNKATWDDKTKAYAETPEFAVLVAAKIKEMEDTQAPEDVAMLKAMCSRSGAIE